MPHYIFLVEDGTEHDFDSHIMVWNVTDPATGPSVSSAAASLSSSANSLRPISTTSSSLDLGPTPGSGVGLDSQSEDYLDTDSETDTLPISVVSQHSVASLTRDVSSSRVVTSSSISSVDTARASTTDIETGTDPLQWSNEVESMLNNPPPDTFQSFHLAAEPSLSSWVVPHYNNSDQLNIDRIPVSTAPYQVDFGSRKKSRSRSTSLKGTNNASNSYSPQRRKDSTPSYSSRSSRRDSPRSVSQGKDSTPSTGGSMAETVEEPAEDFTQMVART